MERMLDINKITCKKCNSKMLKVVSAGFEFYECSKENDKNCDNSFTLYNYEPINTENINYA